MYIKTWNEKTFDALKYLYFLSARLLLGTVQDHLHWLSHAEGLTIQERKRA